MQKVILFLLLILNLFSLGLIAQGPGSPMPNFPLSSFRFNFINPGSRATGMGQAFIAIGDDATGSETNPAGLTALVKPQFFIEGRWVKNTFHTLNPTENQIRYNDIDEAGFSPTFLSMVYPFRNWAFGIYRQELANYSVTPHQLTADLPNVYFINSPGNSSHFKINEFQSRIDVKVINYGFSIARRWGEKINIGFSMRASRFSYHSFETQPAKFIFPAFRVINNDKDAILMNIYGIDWSLTWTGGFIIKPIDWFKIGGVYRSGSSSSFMAIFDENVLNGITDEPMMSKIPNFKINIPDRYGVGFALLPTDVLTFTFDIIRIEYGDMTKQFIGYIQPEFADDYEFSNGDEFHVGGEYTFFVGNSAVSIRGGLYTDPDNTLHFIGDRLNNDAFEIGPDNYLPVNELINDFAAAQRALFPAPGIDYHKTFGIGLVYNHHLQFDFAADFSRDTDYLVLSVLYNF